MDFKINLETNRIEIILWDGERKVTLSFALKEAEQASLQLAAGVKALKIILTKEQ